MDKLLTYSMLELFYLIFCLQLIRSTLHLQKISITKKSTKKTSKAFGWRFIKKVWMLENFHSKLWNSLSCSSTPIHRSDQQLKMSSKLPKESSKTIWPLKRAKWISNKLCIQELLKNSSKGITAWWFKKWMGNWSKKSDNYRNNCKRLTWSHLHGFYMFY